MSFDPFAAGSDPPPEYGPTPRPAGNASQARQRVQAPAIALIVVGVLNLFWALYMLVNGIAWTVAPDFLIKTEKQMFSELPNQDVPREQKQMQGMLVSYPLAVFAFLASVLPIAGGIRMLSLKSYTLGVCGAISAVLPCISIFACCGVGEIVGIWALVVLLNPDVKSAFQ